MTQHDDIDLARDEALGSLLRDHLQPSDNAAFTARVMDRIRQEARETSWDVLARWAPLGMAAAAVLALISGLLLGLAWNDVAEEPVVTAAAPTVSEWLSAPEPVSDDFVLTAVLTDASMAPRGER